jgi:hypothetical protein
MPKGSAVVVVPDAVSWTVIDAVAGWAIISAVTGALMSVLVPNCVVNGVPFHWITEVGVNPVPLARSVKPPSPATTQLPPE